jgi:hypothetical protein
MPRLGSIVPKSLPREFKPSLGVIMHECLHLHIHIPVLSSKYIQMLDLNKGLKLPQTNSRVHHNILQLGSDRKRAIIPNGQFQEGEKSRQKTAVRWIYNENNNIRVLWKWRNKEKKLGDVDDDRETWREWNTVFLFPHHIFTPLVYTKSKWPSGLRVLYWSASFLDLPSQRIWQAVFLFDSLRRNKHRSQFSETSDHQSRLFHVSFTLLNLNSF